jgi:hypothetical protein
MTVNDETIDERADRLSYRAYQMFSGSSKEVEVENSFPMYSYNTPAYTFWGEFVAELMRKGATDQECEWILRHKHMRWMFDNPPEAFYQVARDMAAQTYIDDARINLQEEDL